MAGIDDIPGRAKVLKRGSLPYWIAQLLLTITFLARLSAYLRLSDWDPAFTSRKLTRLPVDFTLLGSWMGTRKKGKEVGEEGRRENGWLGS